MHNEIITLIHSLGNSSISSAAYDVAWIVRLIELGEPVNDNLKRAHFGQKRASKARPPGFHSVTIGNNLMSNGGQGDGQSGRLRSNPKKIFCRWLEHT